MFWFVLSSTTRIILINKILLFLETGNHFWCTFLKIKYVPCLNTTQFQKLLICLILTLQRHTLRSISYKKVSVMTLKALHNLWRILHMFLFMLELKVKRKEKEKNWWGNVVSYLWKHSLNHPKNISKIWTSRGSILTITQFVTKFTYFSRHPWV